MSKGMRNVKKAMEKINHSSKLRTNIQAQMAVGELSHFNSILKLFTSFFSIHLLSWSASRPAAWPEKHQHRSLLQGLQ